MILVLMRLAKRRKSSIPVDENKVRSDAGLSGKHYFLCALLFLALPAACVLVSSVLYYVWKEERPRTASRINTLGLGIVGVQIVVFVVCSRLFYTPR